MTQRGDSGRPDAARTFLAGGARQAAPVPARSEQQAAEKILDDLGVAIEWTEYRRIADGLAAALDAARADEAARWKATLAALGEAVGRGDEYGLPEAYRAALALLGRRDQSTEPSVRAPSQPLDDEPTPTGISTPAERAAVSSQRNEEP